MSTSPAGLKRALGFWALVAYGVGDILGAGIYALMGKVAGLAGQASWIAFAVSMLAAGLTALTYSELVSRFPVSGGEAYHAEMGFRRKSVSMVTGWLTFCSAVFSLSAISVAFAGYLGTWVPDAPKTALIIAFLLGIGFVNFWGIVHSSATNVVFTLIEGTGLVIVLVVGLAFLLGSPIGLGDGAGIETGAAAQVPPNLSPAGAGIDFTLIMQGAALAFFAFIGFEDMVNVAEEVRDPERTFPRAILTALGLAGFTYILIAYLATRIVSPAELSASEAPLMEVVSVATGGGLETIFTFIAVFAVANTGLLNSITASRLIYGMSNQRLLPRGLSAIHAGRQTPHLAILLVIGVAMLLATSGTLTQLAGSTSTLILIVFLLVNMALILIKRRDRREGRPRHIFSVPVWVPAVAIAVNTGLLGYSRPDLLVTAAVLIGLGIAIYYVSAQFIVRRD